MVQHRHHIGTTPKTPTPPPKKTDATLAHQVGLTCHQNDVRCSSRQTAAYPAVVSTRARLDYPYDSHRHLLFADVRVSILLLACLIAWAAQEWSGEKPLPDGWGWASTRADTANCKAFAGKRPSLTSPRPVTLRCTSAAPGYVAARFNFPLDGLRGKAVRLFAQVKVENVSDRARLWLRVDKPGQMGWRSDDMEDRPLTGTSDWVTIVVKVEVPEDASTIFGGIALEGSGTISMIRPYLVPLEIGNAQDQPPPPQSPERAK